MALTEIPVEETPLVEVSDDSSAEIATDEQSESFGREYWQREARLDIAGISGFDSLTARARVLGVPEYRL